MARATPQRECRVGGFLRRLSSAWCGPLKMMWRKLPAGGLTSRSHDVDSPQMPGAYCAMEDE
ncbi:hypothetical protein LEMLEM_LOCUS2744 [Lemmus lemmus]